MADRLTLGALLAAAAAVVIAVGCNPAGCDPGRHRKFSHFIQINTGKTFGQIPVYRCVPDKEASRG